MAHDDSPPEKKRKSLQRDGRNCYGENDKASRKGIRRRKADVNRSFRRAEKQALSDVTADVETLEDAAAQIQRVKWKKAPDVPLGDHLRNKVISDILKRLSVTPKLDQLLARVETELNSAGLPPQAVSDIMQQLRGAAQARRSTELTVEYDTAVLIAGILERGE